MPAARSERLPLTGRRVVALEQAVAAPLCSRHLADLGAEVIKVERPDGGDFARRYDSVVHGESAYFVWLNRGKRSVTADLATEPGRSFMDALLGTADVFVHNLGPGAVERLGYGWEALHDRWPRLISCAVSGYGREGPYRDRKAFDLLVQGESGLAWVTGTPEQPARVGVSIADIAAGMYALSAVLAALLERESTRVGVDLDVAMLDGVAEWMSVPALVQRYTGAGPRRTGLHHPGIAPYGPYAAGDGEPVLVGVQNQAQWRRFCEVVLERPELTDHERFRHNQLRVEHRDELDALIDDTLRRTSAEELRRRLTAADVPQAPVNDVAALLAHPQLAARERWVSARTPSGEAIVVASPLGRPAADAAVPALGADTAALERELGLARNEGDA